MLDWTLWGKPTKAFIFTYFLVMNDYKTALQKEKEVLKTRQKFTRGDMRGVFDIQLIFNYS